MAQADGVVANGTGSAVRSDINNQYAALWSNHSGSTEPSTGKVAYQTWADTNSGYLKIRNAANNAWVSLFKLDGTLSDIPIEGTVVKSTGESGGTKFLREDGDNSCSWQSISQTALTGSTNNTITTVTGANAIQGEANLTFNGSSLTVVDDLNLSGGTPQLKFDDTTSSGYQSYINTDNNELRILPSSGGFGVYTGTDANGANNTTRRLYVENDGDVKVDTGNLIIGTAGKGIDFSAVSHAGGMTSELLDSYEEGTFTPYMRATGGSAGSHAMSALSGTYTKVGRLVFFSLQGYITDKGSWSGTFKWGGLPFTAKNGDNYSCSVSSYPSTVVDGVMRGARVQQNTDYGWISSGSRLDLLADYSEIVTGYYLQLAGTYEAA